MYNFIIAILLGLSYSQYTYSLEDLNPTSDYFGSDVGTEFFENQVSLHYFGHFNWGLCSSRFGQVNDLVENLNSQGYSQVKLVGVGKDIHLQSIGNWFNGNDQSVCADSNVNPVWSNWNANQRDLFLLDHQGNLIFQQSISGGLPGDLEETIIDLINEIGEASAGDVNQDGSINVLDVVAIVSIILNESTYNALNDINLDGSVNVIDVVALVNIILNN